MRETLENCFILDEVHHWFTLIALELERDIGKSSN